MVNPKGGKQADQTRLYSCQMNVRTRLHLPVPNIFDSGDVAREWIDGEDSRMLQEELNLWLDGFVGRKREDREELNTKRIENTAN